MKPRKCLLAVLGIFFMALAAVGFTSFAGELKPEVPPFNLPFDTKKIGEVYTFDVKVVDQLTYAVNMRFYITEPNKYSHFFDRELPEDERRLHTILGGGGFINHEWIEAGVPAKFLVQIFQQPENILLIDKIVSHPKTSATYMGRYADLVQKNLPVGIYTIRIAYLEGGAELAPLHAKIQFARAHHGK